MFSDCTAVTLPVNNIIQYIAYPMNHNHTLFMISMMKEFTSE